ncbi:MAG: pimeloyl-ACP methyl ester carboxylesterase [Candidatus Azotimanducaceae bacterium]|jgi:pimeloyl-ACP methyl ester carboxylesterase
MSDITPFKISASDADLDLLNQKLNLTRWPDKETPSDWTQGIPLAYMQELQEYWLNDYNWREREALINQWPGFITEIDGLDIHFLHIKSGQPNALPLLLTHGWPGSIIEFQKVIKPLTTPRDHGGIDADAFDLVIPTLPGFGFSGKPTETGWNIAKIAAAWDKLMVRLGYSSYVAQGGDWGSIVTSEIGVQNLGHCCGIHMNMPIAPPDPEQMDDLSELEHNALKDMQFYQEHDSGYSKQQSTRPQTLGYGLADSPMGQAAWIIEKYYQWMDCDGHPENIVSRDELLDNVMMYWLPNAAASSARIYWESFGNTGAAPITLPVGCSIFPKEIFKTSERWASKRFSNLIHFEVLDKGGHFAAFEQPEAFVDQVRRCFKPLRNT